MTYSIRRLWLVRHGETNWNATQRYCGWSDVTLSRTGRAQARWLAHQLAPVTLQAIYCSDLSRAHETATLIAARQAHATPLRVSELWRELNFGEWEGLTYDDIADQSQTPHPFFIDPLHHAPPGGESLIDLLQRLGKALARLQAETNAGDIAIVSHGGPIRALLCSALQMPLNNQWRLCLEPGSLSILDLLPPQQPAAEKPLQDMFPAGMLVKLNMQRPAHPRRSNITPEA
jgi:alpha-ribazole phosphatase